MAEASIAEIIEEAAAPKSADDRAIDLGRERVKRTKKETPQEPPEPVNGEQLIMPTFEGIIMETQRVNISGKYELSVMLDKHAEWRESFRLGAKGSMMVDYVVVAKKHDQKHDKDFNGLEGREAISLVVRSITGVFPEE